MPPIDRVHAVRRDDSDYLICDGGPPGFPAAALGAPTGAEREDHPAAEVLRRHAADPGGALEVPATGWRILHRSSREVLYACEEAFEDEVERHLVRVERGRNGTWEWSESAHAFESFDAFREGNYASSWRLDPSADPPAPADTELRVLVTERHCASGRTAEGRIEPPDAFYGDDEIRVVAYVTALPGIHTCPGNPPTPAVFVLPDPVGERRLVDAGQFRV